MRRIPKICMILVFCVSMCFALTLPGYQQNTIMHEQTKSYQWGGDVNVHVNAPGKDSLKLNKETIICFFACPAGNTIEWTIGKQMEPGDDWHYDIQHIGAQTRFLRKVLKDKNVIVIYTQTSDNAWQLYSGKHTDYIQRIQAVTNYALQEFSEFDYTVTLNGHSAGGGFVLRNLLNHSKVPEWIDRLAFLDSNYNYKYNADEYDSLFTKFLMDRDSTYICLLAYNDSVALYQGAHFIGTGGTWCNAKLMKSRLESTFSFIDSHDVDFYRYLALNKRFEILMKKNPTQAILHTTQVYKNGFIHSMLSGTEYENVGYEYYGDPVYLEYIQGNPPTRPEGFSVTPTFGGFRFQALPTDDASGYRLYFSEDGISFVDTLTVFTCDTLLSGPQAFLRVSAINEWGESEKSEWLGITPGDIPNTMLLVNAVNRSIGHNYLLRHGKAALANLNPIASCTNSMIINNKVDLNNYPIVNYVVANEDRRNYPLVLEEIQALKAYLKQGGNLFISGLEIAYALDIRGDSTEQNFCRNYLKFEGVSDKPNDKSSTYYSAEFQGFDFFNIGLSFTFDNGSAGSYNVGDPDGILPINGSYRSLIFSEYDPNISCAGIAYSGMFPSGNKAGKVMVMTIPFETIIGDSSRTLVMGEILNFLQNCDVSTDPSAIPQSSELLAPYPNPFNPRTAISVRLSASSKLELAIYNLQGRKIKTLYSGMKETGKHNFNWNAKDFASGVYICVMSVDGKIYQSQKMVLMK